MAYDEKTGKMKPNTTATGKARSSFAGKGETFPDGDKKHARLAIGAATRSEHAGHISPSEEASIKSKARAKLGEKKDAPMKPTDKQMAKYEKSPQDRKEDAAGARKMVASDKASGSRAADKANNSMPGRSVDEMFARGLGNNGHGTKSSRGGK